MKEKKKVPGPTSYKPNKPGPKNPLYVSKAYTGNAYIDEAIFRGKETPGHQKVKYVRTGN